MGFGLCGAVEIWHRPQPTKNKGVPMKVETEKTVPEAIQKLIGNKGIFHIEWLKKDTRKFIDDKRGYPTTNKNYNKHTILRTGNFRLGVVKNLVGKKRTTEPSDYMIAYDMAKQGYRNIFYNSIQKIVANKKTFYVKTIDTASFRFCLVEQIEKVQIN